MHRRDSRRCVCGPSDLARARRPATYVAGACGLERRPATRGCASTTWGRAKGSTTPSSDGRCPERVRRIPRAGLGDARRCGGDHRQVAAPDGPALAECSRALDAGSPASPCSHGAAIRTGRSPPCWAGRASRPGHLRGIENCGYAILIADPAPGGWRLRGVQPASVAGRRPISSAEGRLAKIPRVARRSSRPGNTRGCGAAGSASAWHAEGQGFESPQLHQHHCRSDGVSGPV